MGRAQGHLLADPRRPRLPQLHRQALLHPVRIDDAGPAQGRPARRQQISLRLVLGVAELPHIAALAGPAVRPDAGARRHRHPHPAGRDVRLYQAGHRAARRHSGDARRHPLHQRPGREARASAGGAGSRSTPTRRAISAAIRARSPTLRAGSIARRRSTGRRFPTAASTTRSTSVRPTSTISRGSRSPPATSGSRATIATSRRTAGSRPRPRAWAAPSPGRISADAPSSSPSRSTAPPPI